MNSDQDKSQEWTAVGLLSMYIEAGESMQPIAEAINAALAVEREKYEAACEGRDQFKAQLSDADKQLAAEREKWIKLCDKTSDNATKAEQQLAVERERFDTLQRQAGELHDRARRAEQQLAAEPEKCKWLGELLAVIHCDGGHYLSEHGTEKATRDAIAKRNEMVMRIDELETQLAAERKETDLERNDVDISN